MMRSTVCLFYLVALCLGVAANKGEGGSEGRVEGGPGPGPPRPGPPRPGPPGPPNHAEVCKDDFMRFCAFRVPDMNNMEDIIKCMNTHLNDLNPMCKEKVENATAALLSFHVACDASLEAQCPDAIGNSMHTGKCVAEHLADLQHGCLVEISKLMMQHRGPPPRMDNFWHTVSIGIDSEEFAFDTQVAMDEGEGRGRKGSGPPPHPCGFFGGVAGGMMVVLCMGLLICIKHRFFGRGPWRDEACRHASHAAQAYPHHPHPPCAHLQHSSHVNAPLAPQFAQAYHQMDPASDVVRGLQVSVKGV